MSRVFELSEGQDLYWPNHPNLPKFAETFYMNHDLLLGNVSRHILLTEEEAAYFTGLFKPREIAKKELVLREGQPCNYISDTASTSMITFVRGTFC